MRAKLVNDLLNEGCGCGGKKRPRPTVVPTQRPAPQRPPIVRRPPPVKQLHEKFSKTGDPIHDMGIGIDPKREAKKFMDDTYGDVVYIAQKYFGNKNYTGLSFVLHGFFKRILNGLDPQDAFYESAENENFYGDRKDIVEERENIAWVIKKFHHIYIDPNDPRL